MDGFDDAVNGYVDVEDGLSRYLLDRAAEGFADEREAKRAIDSRAEFEARRERVRERFVSGIGGLPDRPDDPSVEARDLVERDGYSIERVVFESHPEFRVAANCYVPDADGPTRASSSCADTSSGRRPTRSTSGRVSNWCRTGSSSSPSTRSARASVSSTATPTGTSGSSAGAEGCSPTATRASSASTRGRISRGT